MKKIGNLRRVSVSPWCDVTIAAEELEDNYVLSWKPNPATPTPIALSFSLTDREISEGILQMARQFRDLGVNVSTIGVGTSFDLDIMRNLAREGGGSSRFISNRDEMEETFGSELDRLLVPVAREMSDRLDLTEGVRAAWTFGYDHTIDGSAVTYHVPTLHNRDYETMLLAVAIEEPRPIGPASLGTVTVDYTNLGATAVIGEPIAIEEVDSTARKRAWARLLSRVYEVDPLICPECGSEDEVQFRIRETAGSSALPNCSDLR